MLFFLENKNSLWRKKLLIYCFFITFFGSETLGSNLVKKFREWVKTAFFFSWKLRVHYLVSYCWVVSDFLSHTSYSVTYLAHLGFTLPCNFHPKMLHFIEIVTLYNGILYNYSIVLQLLGLLDLKRETTLWISFSKSNDPYCCSTILQLVTHIQD